MRPAVLIVKRPSKYNRDMDLMHRTLCLRARVKYRNIGYKFEIDRYERSKAIACPAGVPRARPIKRYGG